MNYDTMEAGPEMDRLVAERVMGWTHVRFRPYESAAQGDDARHAGWVGQNPELAFRYESDIPNFSGDIANAWQVVEHMTKTTKQHCELRHGSCYESACFEYEGGRELKQREGRSYGNATTMPAAICAAALWAMEPALKSTHKDQ